ncbi:MBL fold metallo-hydrolase [Sulfurimonas sp. HSL3-7]|uniref:MBL fold metallo-hydrolase n=1 Tax=Sulfonitrofixus jiaomeiensis TaxID=3131938 RepID=UPI0031F91B36
MAKVTSYGAAQTVTGSCHLVKINSVEILIDCGMFQGDTGGMSNYEPFAFDPAKIQYLILTHAHLDHIGRVAKLVKEGFDGEIIATQPTYDIAKIMLLDSAGILEEEYRTLKRKARRRGEEESVSEPLYTQEHVHQVFEKKWHTLEYFEHHKLRQHIRVSLGNAGHIMGSAFVILDYHEESEPKRIVFSGDIGSPHRLIIDSADTVDKADALFIESTYGDRDHKPLLESVHEFKKAVTETLERGGNVLIPSFALERTQEILWLLHEMFKAHTLPECRVFLDSPLAIKATELYNKYPLQLSDEVEWEAAIGSDPFSFKWLEMTSTRDESMEINRVRERAIIIAGSGMCTGGRIMHHLKNRLWNPKNAVIFVGYQVEGTLGRRIIDGAKFVRIYNEEIITKAQVYTINGFSAHADQSDLIDWIRPIKGLKTLCLVHGEEEKMELFAKAINEALKIDAHIMKRGIPVTL